MTIRTTHLNPGLAPPIQGDYNFSTEVLFFEDSSLSGLEAQLGARLAIQSGAPDIYFLVKDVKYQVSSLPGMATSYSVMVILSLATKI